MYYILKGMKYYPRAIEPILKKAARQFRVVVVTGVRQSGKSTLLRHAFSSTHRYVSLDNPRDLKLAQEDPELFFYQYHAPLIIDEIQYVPELVKYIKLRVDQDARRGQFLLTGSQQFLLIKGLQESLAGRAAVFELFPMALSEGSRQSRSYEWRALKGSFPELVTLPKMDAERWFGSYLTSYIQRDVQSFYPIEKIKSFRDFIFLLAARCSQILNCQSLASDLGVSVPAVQSWIKILEASQVIYLLRPYYANLGSRVVKSPKVYFIDTGLVSYIMGSRTKQNLFHGPQAGALFENFVIQEILKFYSNRGERAPVYYYRTNNELEVDCVIEQKGGGLFPVEIKLSKTPQRGMVQSLLRFKALASKKGKRVSQGALISFIDKPQVMTKEINAYPLHDFLNRLK